MLDHFFYYSKTAFVINFNMGMFSDEHEKFFPAQSSANHNTQPYIKIHAPSTIYWRCIPSKINYCNIRLQFTRYVAVILLAISLVLPLPAKTENDRKSQRSGDFQYVLPACSINKSTFYDFIIKPLQMSSFSAVLDFFSRQNRPKIHYAGSGWLVH